MIKRMMTTFVLAAALVAGISAQTPAAPQAPATPQTPAAPAMSKELTSLQGTWVLTTVNDQDLTAAGVEMALVIDGLKYSQVVNGEVNERGTIKIDPAKKPMTFDLNITEGDDAGKLQLGIIEVTGDVAKGLLAMAGGATRPADFNSNDGAIFFIAKRVK